MKDSTNSEFEKSGRPTWWRAIKSVFAAFLGVQTNRNWEEDASSSSPLRFLVVGLLMGLGFFVALFVLVWVVSKFINV
ncbi:DUF2970 domain-containing protein [Salinispirillum marinum]|uniref:DUF2970 domain-containing protein n=2 Tax=Saccharospirillaceae TaxID=255527 RepID=A0ABV8BFR2_9GAMM